MNEHFIKNIEIKNFKCFKDFKAEGFGRVNLIGGKNNVGKTAFMEACYVNSISKDAISYLTALSNTIYMRDYVNLNKEKINLDMKTFYNDKENEIIIINTNINTNLFSVVKKSSLEGKEIYEINDEKESFDISSVKESPFKNLNINNLYKTTNHFLLSSSINNQYLDTLFNQIRLNFKDSDLDRYISYVFGKEFQKFLMTDKKPLIFYKEDWMSLSSLGEGIKRFISIICAIYSSKGGYLFIDEIENGIHYTNLDKLWEIILTISKEQNVQVFATTHSKECIESYARVAKRLEDKEISFIELCKREENIKAFIYPYDWFIDEIEQEHEVRGCL